MMHALIHKIFQSKLVFLSTRQSSSANLFGADETFQQREWILSLQWTVEQEYKNCWNLGTKPCHSLIL